MYTVVSTTSTAFVLLFLCYVALIFVPILRRKKTRSGDASQFEWHFFVPCRDEEAVIGTTIERLRATFPSCQVWVVDDDSDDGTADIVSAHAATDPHVHLVQRKLPDARIGKGAALNAAYRALDAWLPPSTNRTQTVVCVVDADGEMAPNALEQAAGRAAFGDPTVGAVQISVWMKNRHDRSRWTGWGRGRFGSFLVRMQDMEFRTVIAGMQTLRGETRTVGLGGNGQFTRLSVLDELNAQFHEPWHGSLLEDYELGIHVLLAGHEIRYLYDTWVEQEGLFSLRRLVTQRIRWAQGNMQCCLRYLRAILSSPRFDTRGALESSYYLVLPFLQLLGYFCWAFLMVSFILAICAFPNSGPGWLLLNWPFWIEFLIVSMGPFVIWGPLYRSKCEPSAPWWKGIFWGLCFWLYNFHIWAVTIPAFVRLIRRKNGWAKTRRNAETVSIGTVAREA